MCIFAPWLSVDSESFLIILEDWARDHVWKLQVSVLESSKPPELKHNRWEVDLVTGCLHSIIKNPFDFNSSTSGKKIAASSLLTFYKWANKPEMQMLKILIVLSYSELFFTVEKKDFTSATVLSISSAGGSGEVW